MLLLKPMPRLQIIPSVRLHALEIGCSILRVRLNPTIVILSRRCPEESYEDTYTVDVNLTLVSAPTRGCGQSFALLRFKRSDTFPCRACDGGTPVDYTILRNTFLCVVSG
jgi:hypothetical protein